VEPVSDQQRDGIASRMAAARARDKSRSNHMNHECECEDSPLAANDPQSTSNQWSGQQRVVEFVLFGSLPDNGPIVVLRGRGLLGFSPGI
jgi:hypothetical protein